MSTHLHEDRAVLRALAAEYALAAADEHNPATLALHRASNDLKPIRPVVLIDEEPWNQIQAADEFMRIRCTDDYLRGVEWHLRQQLYRWKHYRADMVLRPFFSVRKVVHRGGIGISVEENTLSVDTGNHIISHEYHDQLSTPEALERLHAPEVTYDEAETKRRLQLAGDIFGDILPVRIEGIAMGYVAMWDDISTYRGVGPLLTDLVDDPDHAHACVAKLTDIFLETLKRYEGLDLLGFNPGLVHCTPSTVSALPSPGYDGQHVRPCDLWGRGMAQIFASVSPAMHEEFDIDYMKKAMAPFGLVYYGCCEPLDRKLAIVEKLPNLRKVGCTPWANVDVMAEQVGKRYVLSVKPNPANVVAFDEAVVRAELKRIVAAIRRNGCAADITLKDISTVSHKPESLARWADIAMEEAQSI